MTLLWCPICFRILAYIQWLGRREETFTQNLSESFAGDEGCIEVVVRTYNINYGHNGELLEKCPTLNGYAKFVSMVRENLEMMELPKAVEHAVTECIRQDILKDFLVAQRNEVVAAMKNFGISLEKACAGLDVTVEEYQRVKAQNVRTD